eukprot:6187755-Pleurochrysis_carterae.AAC.3
MRQTAVWSTTFRRAVSALLSWPAESPNPSNALRRAYESSCSWAWARVGLSRSPPDGRILACCRQELAARARSHHRSTQQLRERDCYPRQLRARSHSSRPLRGNSCCLSTRRFFGPALSGCSSVAAIAVSARVIAARGSS